jgi:hypothetical protein
MLVPMHTLRRKRCPPLLVLDDALRDCVLEGRYHEGTHAIPLSAIRGTLDRCCDFDGCFKAQRRELENTLERYCAGFRDKDYALIDVLCVRDAVFVSDGHKRVAAARRAGAEYIDADVTCVVLACRGRNRRAGVRPRSSRRCSSGGRRSTSRRPSASWPSRRLVFSEVGVPGAPTQHGAFIERLNLAHESAAPLGSAPVQSLERLVNGGRRDHRRGCCAGAAPRADEFDLDRRGCRPHRGASRHGREQAEAEPCGPLAGVSARAAARKSSKASRA